MAVSFPRLPKWLCGSCGNTKEREKKGSLLNPKTMVKKMKRGWIGRGGEEEEKMGNVVFPEPDDPEWSTGWVEPHGPGFKSDDDDDDESNGFVVLVPCYKKVIDDSKKNQILNGYFYPSPDGKNMKQWLSSMGML